MSSQKSEHAGFRLVSALASASVSDASEVGVLSRRRTKCKLIEIRGDDSWIAFSDVAQGIHLETKCLIKLTSDSIPQSSFVAVTYDSRDFTSKSITC